MNRTIRLSVNAILAACCLSAIPAVAGPYGDAMSKCLVNSTSTADRTLLVQWMFATAALHPDVRSLSAASDAERDKLNRQMGALVERLLSQACTSETKAAVQYEGRGTLENSFNALGQVAGRELFSDPSVSKSMGNFAKYLNEKKLSEALGTKN